jgi:peptide/nickel transport system ATP-binding protein
MEYKTQANEKMSTANIKTPLIQVKDLRTYFFLEEGTVKAVDGVDLSINRGGTVGIVGESGCGKSVTAYSIVQLVVRPGKVVTGEAIFYRKSSGDEKSAQFDTIDLLKLPANGAEMRKIRGGEISMIFQEPMVSLSPVHTIGDQISENVLLHFDVPKKDALDQAADMLKRVGIPKPEERLNNYPFQLSGGMRQRAMIALALICRPSLLIADEPTTALDVTTQAQIIELIGQLQRDLGMAVMMITHNLGVVAEMCEEVVVMYLGEVVEHAPVDPLFHDPLHPYTRALLKSIPVLGASKGIRLQPIEGVVPDPYNRPKGCPFHPRCASFMPGRCDHERPPLYQLADGREVRCLLYENQSKGG